MTVEYFLLYVPSQVPHDLDCHLNLDMLVLKNTCFECMKHARTRSGQSISPATRPAAL